MKNLRKRLAKTMINKRGKLSHSAFAEKIGVSKTTLIRLEKQEHNVTLDILEHLCKKFKCDIHELFSPPK